LMPNFIYSLTFIEFFTFKLDSQNDRMKNVNNNNEKMQYPENEMITKKTFI
jgi:hypothetical protein